MHGTEVLLETMGRFWNRWQGWLRPRSGLDTAHCAPTVVKTTTRVSLVHHNRTEQTSPCGGRSSPSPPPSPPPRGAPWEETQQVRDSLPLTHPPRPFQPQRHTRTCTGGPRVGQTGGKDRRGQVGCRPRAAPPHPSRRRDPIHGCRVDLLPGSSVTKCPLSEGTKGTAREVILNPKVPTSFVRGAWQARSRRIQGQPRGHLGDLVTDLPLLGTRGGAKVLKTPGKTRVQTSALSRKQSR